MKNNKNEKPKREKIKEKNKRNYSTTIVNS